MCDVLGVSRSGYYSWLGYKPGKMELANRKLDVKMLGKVFFNTLRVIIIKKDFILLLTIKPHLSLNMLAEFGKSLSVKTR
jgi:hypothetical protein